MRVYYAVWEDVEEGEGGFRSGAISTEGGGNLHWDDNQFQVVHKDDYDKLVSKLKWAEYNRDHAVSNEKILASRLKRCTEVLELIKDKSPRCDCMDAPGLASAVLLEMGGAEVIKETDRQAIADCKALAEALDMAEDLLSVPERHQDETWYEKCRIVQAALTPSLREKYLK